MTQHDTIRKIMRRRARWTPLDLQRAYEQETETLLLDSTLTRRLREMTDVICERKTRNGKTRWEYRLVKSERRAA